MEATMILTRPKAMHDKLGIDNGFPPLSQHGDSALPSELTKSGYPLIDTLRPKRNRRQRPSQSTSGQSASMRRKPSDCLKI